MSQTPHALIRLPSLGLPHRFVAMFVLPALLAAAGPALAESTRGQVGEWSSPVESGVIAIHMALLRGPQDSSRVIYWSKGATTKLWRYAHDANFSVADVIAVPCASDLFCSGHSTLADGRLLVAGGSHTTSTGIDDSNIFDPQTNLWTAQTPAHYSRWYPTCTTLGNGNVLLTAGDQHNSMDIFGGNDGTVLDQASRITLGDHNHWEDIDDVNPRAQAREDHSAVWDPNLLNNVIFGGRGDDGLPRSDVWLLRRFDNETLPNDHTWTWTALAPLPDPVAGAPAARSRHSAIFWPSDSSMIIYGGLAANGSPLGDVWKLKIGRQGPLQVGRWTRLNVVGPQPRYGHTAILASNVVYLKDNGLDQAMVVFGGHNGTAATDSVWALKLTKGSEAWSTLAVTGTAPSARTGHSATQVNVMPSYPTPARMYVFGGQNNGTYFNNLVALEWAATGPRWVSINVSNPPVARARHTVIYNVKGFSLMLFGGETGPGALTNDLHEIHAYLPTAWNTLDLEDAPVGLAGHSAIYNPVLITARIPEIFQATADNLGSWQDVPKAERILRTYPFMFLLPNGKIFAAGSDDDTRLLDLDAGVWEPSVIPSSFNGGSAVMYEPGKILKHGSIFSQPFGTTETIDFSDPNPHWTAIAPSVPRSNSNVTALPTGDVILTGGCSSDTCTSQRSPQIWKPGTDWGPVLARDDMRRDYHSTAMLLPDGRIISAGGDRWSSDRTKVSIFSPPYLFTASGDPAPRPLISSAPSQISHGMTAMVHTPQVAGIASACLIRPGAVTHAFDENQRYVPLTFVPNVAAGRLQVSIPADSNLAPPGDYLLFIVDGNGVPSIAKWVSLRAVAPSLAAPPSPVALRFSSEPNPVQHAAQIRYTVDAARAGAPFSLAIYDLSGRRVRGLSEGLAMLGESRLKWDLRSEAGSRVPAGIYYLRFSLGQATQSFRIAVVH